MVIGVSEGPGAVRMQNAKEAEKCPFAFLRRKILPRYYKLTKLRGTMPCCGLWKNFKHLSGGGNPLLLEPALCTGVGGLYMCYLF